MLARGGFATLGWLGGGLAGVMIGRALDTTDGEDVDLTGTVLGAAVGTTLGSGLGAAAPRYGSRCTFGKRLANGLLGSLAGAGAGALLAGNTHSREVGIVIPIGSAAGAALAVGC